MKDVQFLAINLNVDYKTKDAIYKKKTIILQGLT
jgi:hypothetical protein